MRERLTRRTRTEGEAYGGSEPPELYVRQPGTHYSEKPQHREMSLFHQPQHAEHWKKQDKKSYRLNIEQ